MRKGKYYLPGRKIQHLKPFIIRINKNYLFTGLRVFAGMQPLFYTITLITKNFI